MEFSTLRRWLAAAATAALSLAATTVASAQGALQKFNYGVPTADYYVLYVAKDQGLFQKQGLDPQFFFFPSGAPLLAALKSESVDIISTGLATAFALGQKIPLKLIFWEMDDSAGEGVIVSPKSGIRTITDLPKAKAIGAPSGTCAQVALGLIARKIGVKPSDFKTVNIAPPLYANAFSSNSLDAGVAWAPFLQALAEQGQTIIAYDADYGIDGGICPVMTGGRTKFLQQNPEIGHKLVRINAEAAAMIEKNPQLAIDALVKYLSVTPTVAKATYERLCCARRPTFAQQLDPASPYSMVNRDGGLVKKLLIATQVLAEAGTIPAALTVDEIVQALDTSYLRRYVEAAGK
ncbi:MAG TPA: ABC transporter substrate-binding protein [Burkholderiaceae bacterium]|nr:ABC transporter substrate-binding protein [Burkholderiaceae bacterium]